MIRAKLLVPALWIIAVAASSIGSASAEEPIPIAVLTFANQVQGPEGEDWAWLEKGLADLLINDLATQPGLVLVDRERMQQTLDAMGAAAARAGHEDRLIGAFVERFKVSRLVFGSYRVDGNTITLHATVSDAQTGRLVDRIEVKGELGRLFKLQKQLSGRVAAALLGRADPEKIAASLPVWTESLPASKLFYEAVDYFDQGRLDESWLLARRALRMDPAYADALYWVGRMHYYLLQYPHARRYFEQFVYAYPQHSRVGDAVVEFLDTYERGLADHRKRAEEIRLLMKQVPQGTRIKFYKHPSWGVLFNYDLHFYLALRRAEYLIATTDYARAARELVPFFYKAKAPDNNREPSITVYERARLATGEVLGQPTTIPTLMDRPNKFQDSFLGEVPGSSWFTTFRVYPLRPGQGPIDLLPSRPTLAASITQDLFLVPPNYQLDKMVLSTTVKAPDHLSPDHLYNKREPDEGDDWIKSVLWRRSVLDRGARRGFFDKRDRAALAPQYTDQDLTICPYPAGKVYVAYVFLDSDRRAGFRWEPDVDCDIARLQLTTELTPSEQIVHLLIDRGIGAFHRYDDEMFNERELRWRSFYGSDDAQLGYVSHHMIESSDVPFQISAQCGNTILAAMSPPVAPDPRWPDALYRRHRVAVDYSPQRDMAIRFNEASVTIGHEAQWLVAWSMGGDVWLSSSTNAGQDWRPAEALPVPANSAHAEETARLVALRDHEYALLFQSDRGIERRVRWYVTYSQDRNRSQKTGPHGERHSSDGIGRRAK